MQNCVRAANFSCFAQRLSRRQHRLVGIVYLGRLHRAVLDYNETRASDIFVVNFGAHYHDNPEDDAKFRAHVSPILDAMAELGEHATVVWRWVESLRRCARGKKRVARPDGKNLPGTS